MPPQLDQVAHSSCPDQPYKHFEFPPVPSLPSNEPYINPHCASCHNKHVTDLKLWKYAQFLFHSTSEHWSLVEENQKDVFRSVFNPDSQLDSPRLSQCILTFLCLSETQWVQRISTKSIWMKHDCSSQFLAFQNCDTGQYVRNRYCYLYILCH